MAQLNRYITSGSDDVYTTSGQVPPPSLNTSNLYVKCGYNSFIPERYYPGLRFINIYVPHLAQIDSATLLIDVSNISNSIDVNFYGDDVDNASQWASDNQPYEITKTTATKFTSIIKVMPVTISVTNIIQEIIDRPGWNAGNAIRLAGFPSGTPAGNNTFNFRSYEYGSDFAKLTINYTLPSKNNDISLVINGMSDIQTSGNLFIHGHELYPDSKLYFNLWHDKQLRRINLDGSNQIDILDLDYSHNIAINKSEQRIYVTDKNTPADNVLKKCNFIGDDLDIIASGLDFTNPQGLTISERLGKVYWSINVSNSMIYNCDLDGSNKQIIIPAASGLDFVSDLFADDVSNKLYWTDKNAVTISRANLDGTDIEIILSSTILRPLGIWVDGYDKRVYFIDESNNGTLYSCNLCGSNLQIIASGFANEPDELTINKISNEAFVTDGGQGKIFKIKLDGMDTQAILDNASGILDIAIDPAEFVPSYINGHSPISVSSDLFINGHESLAISGDLFIHGYIDNVLSNDLFTWGHIDTLASGDLFIHGDEDTTTSSDLFVHGHVSLGTSSDLFIHGHADGVSSDNLFIHGHLDCANSGNLFIDGHIDTSGVSAPSLFICGYEVVFASGDSFICGHDATGGGPVNLYINGYELIMLSGDLFLQGCISCMPTMSLFVCGHSIIQASDDLFVYGHIHYIASGDLFIDGSGIVGESGNLNFLINGYEPKPALACPILDPTASIQIKDSLIRIYQSRIDALINQLGKNVYLEFDPIREPCINCEFDVIRKRSTGIYKIGGPRPFARGRKCPYCKGRGFKETAVNKCIKCLIKWNPKDAENFGIAISQTKGIVRLKTYLTEADDLMRAKTVIVNHDIVNQMKLRVRLIQGPIPVGLREDRYCISFWELL